MNYNNMILTKHLDNLSEDSNCFVKVECIKCNIILNEMYNECIINIKENGNYICKKCIYKLNKNSSDYYDNILDNINTKEKAYLLGWLINNIKVEKLENIIVLQGKMSDYEYINNLKNMINPNSFIYKNDDGYICYNIESKQIYKMVLKHLKIINNNIKDATFPIIDPKLVWYLIRGMIESNDFTINTNNENIQLILTSDFELILNYITYISNIPYERISSNSIMFINNNCIDFLGKMYNNAEYDKLYIQRLYNQFINCINIKTKAYITSLPKFRVCKTNKDAIIPTKNNISDVGYDITIIKLHKQLNENTFLYDTGIKIIPDFGYYTELVPRSSLSKSGYMLSNSIGIIENSYRGNLYVALTKIEKNAKDLVLPFKCTQLIFKKQEYLQLEEIIDISNDKTIRNNGGFGSTN